jgi:prophage antirepressor-like protein
MEIVKAFNTNKLHTEIVIKGTIEEPLFRASDVAEILEILAIRNTIADYDETEKVSITSQTNGGNQIVSFLTEKGLYKLLFRSRKPIAEKFQNWVCEVIKEIRLKGSYTLQQELEEIKKENEILQKKIEESTDNVPTIYIWNTNVHLKKPELKIGITLNVHKRVKPYKQINKHGKIEFTLPILNVDIKMFEKVIHSVLHNYKVQDEVFQIDVEEAKLVIIYFVNFIKLTQINNPNERINKIQKVYENQHMILNNIKNNISTNEIGTQTEEIEETMEEKEMKEIQEQNEKKEKDRIQHFQKYIEECCIIRSDVEVSSTEILGQYRILSKTAQKEIYHELKYFLDLILNQEILYKFYLVLDVN